MNRYVAYAILTLSLALMGCSAQQSEEEFASGVEGNPLPKGLSYLETFFNYGLRLSNSLDSNNQELLRQAHQAFALAEYRRLGDDADNIATSVIDKQLLLGMTALGSSGTTLDAVRDASGLVVNNELPHAQVNDWDQHLAGLSGISATRHFWGQERYLFADNYLENIAQFYGPVMTALDFQAAAIGSADQVNESLSDQLTVSAIDYRTRIVMTQTVEVNQTWSNTLAPEPFRGRFATDDGQRRVEMVRLEGVVNVADIDQYRAVEVPLAGNELALLVIEPKSSFANFIGSLDQVMLQSILNQLSLQQTVIKLPVFDLEEEFTDHQVADLGVAAVEEDDPPVQSIPSIIVAEGSEPLPLIESEPLPFIENVSDNEANFYPVNKAGYLYLSEINQNVAMVLTEDGLSTVAASAVVHRAKRDEPRVLIGDEDFTSPSFPASTTITLIDHKISCYYPADQRPFLFALYAPNSGTLLAVGHVSEPDGEQIPEDWTESRSQGCGSSPPVEIYQHTGEIQCESSGVDHYTMRYQLRNAGIEILASGSGTDGLEYPSACGAATGNIFRFTIREQDLELTQEMGFSRTSELESPTW